MKFTGRENLCQRWDSEFDFRRLLALNFVLRDAIFNGELTLKIGITFHLFYPLFAFFVTDSVLGDILNKVRFHQRPA
jgi:hypothetical protein